MSVAYDESDDQTGLGVMTTPTTAMTVVPFSEDERTIYEAAVTFDPQLQRLVFDKKDAVVALIQMGIYRITRHGEIELTEYGHARIMASGYAHIGLLLYWAAPAPSSIQVA